MNINNHENISSPNPINDDNSIGNRRSDTMAGERTFTQKEVDQLISDRLKRERNTLEAYKAQMAAEAAAQAEAKAMEERFTAALGDQRKVIHPRLTPLLIEDFAAAVNDPANADKSDNAIFSDLFANGGYFVPPNYKVLGATIPLTRACTSPAPDALRQAFGFKERKE